MTFNFFHNSYYDYFSVSIVLSILGKTYVAYQYSYQFILIILISLIGCIGEEID